MSLLGDIDKLHITLRTFIIGICILTPFWFVDLIFFQQEFVRNNPIYFTVSIAFCLSIIGFIPNERIVGNANENILTKTNNYSLSKKDSELSALKTEINNIQDLKSRIELLEKIEVQIKDNNMKYHYENVERMLMIILINVAVLSFLTSIGMYLHRFTIREFLFYYMVIEILFIGLTSKYFKSSKPKV